MFDGNDLRPRSGDGGLTDEMGETGEIASWQFLTIPFINNGLNFFTWAWVNTFETLRDRIAICPTRHSDGSCKPDAALKGKDGGPRAIRTPDPQIRSLMLYPAELWIHCGGD
jgi:hypothetical protein